MSFITVAARLWDDLDTAQRALAIAGSLAIMFTSYRSFPGHHGIRRILGDLGWPVATLSIMRSIRRDWTDHQLATRQATDLHNAHAELAGWIDGAESFRADAHKLVDFAKLQLRDPAIDERLATRWRERLDAASVDLSDLDARIDEARLRMDSELGPAKGNG
jgi:hypothetical protein